MLPTFVTGNKNKLAYLNRQLGIQIPHQKIDLDEIQSPDGTVVAEHKAKQAYDLLTKPVLIEDTSLCFNALGGLPGTFIKFFVTVDHGIENMCRMLDGFQDRSAYATAVYTYYDGTSFKNFAGRLDGTISMSPRGHTGYDWDQIFQPDGYGGRTRAELTPEEDAKTYDQIRNMTGLKAFLLELIAEQESRQDS